MDRVRGYLQWLGVGCVGACFHRKSEPLTSPLPYFVDSVEYAKVVRMLGNGRLEAFCFDGKVRLCHIRGKMRKKVWVGAGDIIMVSLRDYQDE
jgi:initiation factor 1A